jgi:hypothetical protein
MDLESWGDILLADRQTKYISIGDLHLWLKSRNGEVWIAHGYGHEVKREGDKSSPPNNITWGRWANNRDTSRVRILPVFPDKPLIIHSEYPLKVSPGTRIQIYSRIPVWVRISLTKDDYQVIELPTVKLSRTWFGTPVEGELCYHATTKARRDLAHVDKKQYLVSCPIMIHNKSREELDFEHFCFRVERLSMYDYKSELWADETQIVYHGADLNSDVIMTGKLPKGIDKKNLLSKPRKRIQKSFATRTFKRIFEDTMNWGR